MAPRAGAFECYERGVRDLADAATIGLVAAVLAELLGHPSDVIEGEVIQWAERGN